MTKTSCRRNTSIRIPSQGETMALNKPVVIEKYESEFPLTFEFLRTHGIQMVQEFSGSYWTDYNLHDPGVTILEQLCFAITDLSYRTEFPLEDLLASEKGVINRQDHIFIAPQKALSSKPVSINDFRKYTIDRIPELKNVWIDDYHSPYTRHGLRGLYQVMIQIDEAVAESDSFNQELVQNIKEKTITILEQSRNLCEDFMEVISLKQQEVGIKADVLISDEAVPEEVLANMYIAFTNALNPSPRYLTEKELIAKGLKIEDIYDGPLLRNGVQPDTEMKTRRTEIDPSDLLNALIKVKGVESVKKLSLISGDTELFDKPLKLIENHYAVIKKMGFSDKIRFYRNKFIIYTREDKFLHFFHKITQQSKREYISSVHQEEKQGVLHGRYRNPGKYYSLQDHFPFIYGIGKDGMPNDQPLEAFAKMRQLKAYLMLFEQVLANYLSQLQHLSKLYSPEIDEKSRTYFSQPLYDVPGAAAILKSFTSLYNDRVAGAKEWEQFVNGGNNDYAAYLSRVVESDEIFKKRKNKLMDHLLARFNLSLTGYAVSLYNLYYDNGDSAKRADAMLQWKADILKNIDAIILNRSRATSYTSANPYEVAKSSFEQNMYRFLYIRNGFNKRLSQPDVGGGGILITPYQLPKEDRPPASRTITVFGEVMNITDRAHAGLAVNEVGDAVIWNQPVYFLKSGINSKNYKVVRDPDNPDDFLIVYKRSVEKLWQVIGTDHDESQAYRLLDNTINAVKKLSLEGEGFHMVEHILLRPALSTACFGFRFLDDDLSVMLQETTPFSYAQREEAIGQLLEAAAAERTDDLLTLLNKYCKPGDLNSVHQGFRPDTDIFRHVNNHLKFFQRKKNDVFPAFQYTVKVSDTLTVNEAFYSYGISFVFPSWPARFQDAGYRDFAENVLKEYTPAHIASSFYWLKATNMMDFEDHFFAWQDIIRNAGTKTKDQDPHKKLTAYLANKQYIIPTN